MNSICASLIYIFDQARTKCSRNSELKCKLTFEDYEIYEVFIQIVEEANFLGGDQAQDIGTVITKIDLFSDKLQKELPQVHQKLTSNGIPLMTYFIPFYMTLFLHMTPMVLSGKILDLYMMISNQIVDHLLMGLLVAFKGEILKLDNEDKICRFIQKELMEKALIDNTLSNLLMPDLLMDIFELY